jgi:uncharacterized membrane protein
MSAHPLDPSGAIKAESSNGGNNDHVTSAIQDIVKLESVERSLTDRIAERITKFTGSMTFIWLHVFWFTTWILINAPWLGQPIDPFPFTLLTMIVSLEAIFLSAFILIAENTQGRLADRRARVDLQVNMIAEREITKLMELVVEIHSELKIRQQTDAELDKMRQATNIEQLTEVAQKVENKNHDDRDS